MKGIIKQTSLIVIIFHLSCFIANGQIAINTDGTNPDASAMLDITSTTKGVLIPRMTTIERENINSPATGLLVYDTDYNSFWYYANAVWINLSNAILADADSDTKIQVEESSDEDIIRFDLNGTEFMRLDSGRIEIVNTGNSIFLGEGAGANDDFSNNRNIYIGYQSGYLSTTGVYNTFNGYQTGYSNTTGSHNTFFGYQSGYANTTGYSNTFIGNGAGDSNTSGTENLMIGTAAGRNNKTGSANVFQGYMAGNDNTTGSNNVYLGYESGYNNNTGSNNIYLGYQAGYNASGSNKLYIDNSNTSSPLLYGEFNNDLLQINGTLNINDAFSFPTKDGNANQVLTTDGNGTVSWSNNNSFSLIDGDNDTQIQVEESSDEDIIRFDLGGIEYMRLDGGRLEFLNTGNSVFIGENAGKNDNLSTANTFIGKDAGKANISGYNSVAIGANAYESATTAYENVTMGYAAARELTTGYQNVTLGFAALENNQTGNKNTVIGYNAGQAANLHSKSNNVLIGYNAAKLLEANSNTIIGYEAGLNTTSGASNIFLGYQAGYNETGSNKLYIENTNSTSPLIYGEFNNDFLQINGKLAITDGFSDIDGDTKIQLEESSDDDIIRFDLNGTEFMRLDSGRIEILNTGSSIFIGEDVGINDDFTNNKNIFIGYKTGYTNSSGHSNIFSGYYAGYSNSSGSNNIFFR